MIERAFDLFGEHNLTVYDALFLVLAMEHGAIIFSADEFLLKIAGDLNLL